jgi:hypothetical protein
VLPERPPQARAESTHSAEVVLPAYTHSLPAAQLEPTILQLPPEQQGVPHISAQLTSLPTLMARGSPTTHLGEEYGLAEQGKSAVQVIRVQAVVVELPPEPPLPPDPPEPAVPPAPPLPPEPPEPPLVVVVSVPPVPPP